MGKTKRTSKNRKRLTTDKKKSHQGEEEVVVEVKSKSGTTTKTDTIISYEKLDQEINWYSKKITRGYDRPRKRFIRDIITGLVKTGKCLLSQISSVVKRKEKMVHSVEKRLSLEINSPKWTEDRIRENHYDIEGSYLDDQTIVALDITDINKDKGKVFENLTRVMDGSTKQFVDGYEAIVIEAVKSKSNHIPLYMELYSSRAKGFTSQFDQVKKAVEEVTLHFGHKGLWTMDRGFDSIRTIKYFFNKGLKFLLRGLRNHKIIVVSKRRPSGTSSIEIAGQSNHTLTSTENTSAEDNKNLNKVEELLDVVKTATLRGIEPYFQYYQINPYSRRKRWQKKTSSIRYDYLNIKMLIGEDEDALDREMIDLNLVVVEGIAGKNERGFFLTNITVESLNDALSVIKKYSKRWPCEEAIRFVKQSFHLEDVRVQSYLSLRRMMIFAMIAYEFICLLIRRLLVKNKKVFFYLKSLTIKRNKEVIFVHYKISEAIVKLSAWAMIANMNFT